jgi:hypothetical protein
MDGYDYRVREGTRYRSPFRSARDRIDTMQGCVTDMGSGQEGLWEGPPQGAGMVAPAPMPQARGGSGSMAGGWILGSGGGVGRRGDCMYYVNRGLNMEYVLEGCSGPFSGPQPLSGMDIPVNAVKDLGGQAKVAGPRDCERVLVYGSGGLEAARSRGERP